MRKLNQRTHTKTKAAQALVTSSQEAMNTGLVVATHGRHCVVELDDGSRIICHPRGKKSQSVVGDRVRWQAAADEGTIESVLTRKNLFYRRDEVRTKSFAANLDQVLILLAAEPEFSETQLSRALIAAEAEHIKPLIVLNKSDLGAAFQEDDLDSGPIWRRKKYLGQCTGSQCSRFDRRDLSGFELGQTHHHKHVALLGWQPTRPFRVGNAGYRHHRFTGFSGVWPSAHSTKSIGCLHARFEAACAQLQVLQLHPFARAWLWSFVCSAKSGVY